MRLKVDGQTDSWSHHDIVQFKIQICRTKLRAKKTRTQLTKTTKVGYRAIGVWQRSWQRSWQRRTAEGFVKVHRVM